MTTSDSSTSRNESGWYCKAADDDQMPRCSGQCASCRDIDTEEAADAQTFRDNMERECKP